MLRGIAAKTRERTGLQVFFQICRKCSVRWASANEKEQRFIEEVARVTYERERAVRLGLPLTDLRPSFVP